jgi:hypothetical protein
MVEAERRSGSSVSVCQPVGGFSPARISSTGAIGDVIEGVFLPSAEQTSQGLPSPAAGFGVLRTRLLPLTLAGRLGRDLLPFPVSGSESIHAIVDRLHSNAAGSTIPIGLQLTVPHKLV